MILFQRTKKLQAGVVLAGALLLSTTSPVFAQDYSAPSFSQAQVDGLVSRIALYPDPLLAQVFAAASFPDQIPQAAQWSEQYRNLRGAELADAIYQANLPFEPAVQALIPLPSVLDMMARDMAWTTALGNAVLSDRPALMDAVQRMRRSAEGYGYLSSNQQIRVVNSGYGVEIQPVDPGLIYVPVYDPYVVYAPARPGFYVGGAIGFGSCYSLGAFGGWGWGGGFNWNNHAVILNRSVWGRTWDNREAYVHNYGNWDRGEWRNNYGNRNGTIVNNQRIYNADGNRGYNGNYRSSQQSQYRAPVQQSRGFYDRGAGGAYGNSQQPSYEAPVQQQSRGSNDRGSNGNYRSSQQPSYQAPVQQAPAYQAPAQQGRGSYDRGFRNSQPVYQAPVQQAPAYQAPAQQSRGSYDRGFRNSQPAYQAPVQQARVQQAPVQQQGRGSYDRGFGGGSYRSAQPVYQAPSPQQGFGGGNSSSPQSSVQENRPEAQQNRRYGHR